MASVVARIPMLCMSHYGMVPMHVVLIHITVTVAWDQCMSHYSIWHGTNIQWNLCNPDTLGLVIGVLIIKVS